MRVTIIGGSHGIGRQTVLTALDSGHIVTVFSRNPTALGIKHNNLRLVAGNVLDSTSLKPAITGSDAVICALGITTRQAIGPPFSKANHVLRVGTKNILKSMSDNHVKRLICVTAIGTGDSANHCSLLTRLTLRYGLKRLFQEKDAQEQLIKDQPAIEWTIVRPTALTNGSKKGATANNSVRAGFFTHISRADVAQYMISIVDQESTYKKTFILTNPPKFGDSLRWLAGNLGIN